jgi:DNA-binding NarL/FixJ family response regulator
MTSMMSHPITIVLVDDHAVVRAGLRAILSGEEFEVIGEAEDGDEAIELAQRLAPRVVLMDLQMPKVDGIAATQKIKLARPQVQIVVLTTYETESDVTRAIAAGAVGYLLKDAPRSDIVQAVRAAARGQATLSSQAAAHLMNRSRSDASSLTKRELEVLERVAKGASNREIAIALRVSEATIKTHLIHAFEKLGVSDRTAAVTVAIDRKFLRL